MGGELSPAIRPGEGRGLWKVGVGIGTIAGRGPGQTDDGWDPGKCSREGLGCSCLAGSASQPGPGDPGTLGGLSHVRGLHPRGSSRGPGLNQQLSEGKTDPEQPGLLLHGAERLQSRPSRSPDLLSSIPVIFGMRSGWRNWLRGTSREGQSRWDGNPASLRGWNGEEKDEMPNAGGSGSVPPCPCRAR